MMNGNKEEKVVADSKNMNNLLDLFKNINSIEDVDLKHTLEVMIAKSGASIPEDTAWYYENQKKVILQKSNIKSLEPLKYLPNIKILVLDENNIDDISPLSNLPNLYHLNLIGNEISELYIEGDNPFPSLREMYLGLNLLREISPLSGLTNLRILGLRGNTRIADVSSLTRLVSLVGLNLSGTSVNQEDVDRLIGALPGCKVTI